MVGSSAPWPLAQGGTRPAVPDRVGWWLKAGNSQGPAPQSQRMQKRPTESKKVESEDVLAVTLPGPRKPLEPLDYPMDGSLKSPHTMDTSIVLEDEKSGSVNEVPDYHEDVHTYRREMETVTNSMKAILENWLAEVGEEYKLQNETLHLAVNYLDRFLSSMSKQVLRMQHLVLKVLAFDLALQTVNQFLTQYFLHQQPAKGKVENADSYLQYLPSVITAVVFHVAIYTVLRQSWPESLPCLMDLHQTYLRAPQHFPGVSLLSSPGTLNV
ncbi:hypothetical protein FD754_012728 [Muntiacus muntjak]|uniref:Cyclin N-terminal domain-containing protein n=1 Tax=Muntiacus muntjak TaxID=9888 RepID=A0A5N3VF57_MUNMU|nr:hypothetical protein FD754_012728 [Muntiacus muntjak]